MVSTLLFCLLAAAQIAPVNLTIVTARPDARTDFSLNPAGSVEVRRENTITRVRARVEPIEPLLAFGPAFRAYVVWAVSPEGEFANLGELDIRGRRGEVEGATGWQQFGILITAEPHHLVDAPSTNVAFRSGPPRNTNVRAQEAVVRPVHDYAALTLPPQGSVPARVTQARAAYRVAESVEGADLVGAELRQARVALDSMEELLRRVVPDEILDPYVHEAIRLSARAVRLARERVVRNELEERAGRIAELERAQALLRQETERLGERQAQADARLAELLGEIQSLHAANRSLELDRDDARRRLNAAETELADLRRPWRRFQAAAIRETGARETTAGLTLTLGRDQFAGNRATLTADAQALLDRLGVLLTYEEPPRIQIEGHTTVAGAAARNQTLSEERAAAVRDRLIAAGVPEDLIVAAGHGGTMPIAQDEDSLNERVEIIFQPRS